MIIEQTQSLIELGSMRFSVCDDPELHTMLALVIEALRQVQSVAKERKLTGPEFLQYRDVLIDAKQFILIVDEAKHVAIRETACLQQQY
ncbi:MULTISPECIES: hypothetical protein [Aeromonas]|uniref:Uncharacterized protein n=1 Tax=Aeromonas veronii TaxID=654 RepID=A0A4S5CDN5_AERVE|nr:MULTISPECIES: hypothetical protein [Aeromonas]THJ43680.1 hypothetical protein E8Q35_15350 [Aeromonas veronii]